MAGEDGGGANGFLSRGSVIDEETSDRGPNRNQVLLLAS